jgi:CBS domain containing-hemolysin-like protein
MTPAITILWSTALGLLLVCSSVASYLRLLMRRLSPVAGRELFRTEASRRIRADRERVGVSISALHGAAMALFAIGLFALFRLQEPQHFWGSLGSSVLVVFGSIALVDQLIPFMLVARHDEPEVILHKWLPFLRLCVFAALPLTFPVLISTTIARLLETPDQQKEGPPTPQEELQELIKAGERAGLIERSEGKLLKAVVEFADKIVREVMTPRPEIAAIEINASIEDFRKLFRERRQSRYPVYTRDLDHIEGIVSVQALMELSPEQETHASLRTLVRPVPFVPETKLIHELLKELQRSTTQMAMVVDEYGSVSGLVTIEDLVEEIVGEIRDTIEPHSHDISREPDDTYIVAGHTELAQLADQLHVPLEGQDYSTVAGLVLAQLGHVPSAGEKVEKDGVTFTVLEASQRTVLKVRMKLPSTEPAPAPSHAEQRAS